MPSQDGTRSFSFRIPANGSIVAPHSLLVVAKTLQSKEPGALLSAGGALPYAVFETSHRRVFSMGLCKRVALHPPPPFSIR